MNHVVNEKRLNEIYKVAAGIMHSMINNSDSEDLLVRPNTAKELTSVSSDIRTIIIGRMRKKLKV